MRDEVIITGVVLDDACLSLEELAGACAVTHEWVRHRVEEGLLVSRSGQATEWRFSSRDLWRARHLQRIERDFDAAPELAALVTDLLEELDTLRAQLRRIGSR